jgi:hypothetical protein
LLVIYNKIDGDTRNNKHKTNYKRVNTGRKVAYLKLVGGKLKKKMKPYEDY